MENLSSVEKELGGVSPERETLLTIGVFDGVHRGHKFLLARLKDEAKKLNLATGVVTFRQHPQEVLSPESRLPYLTSVEEKVSLLKLEGIDFVIALTFTREMAQYSARQFVELLQKHLRMRGLVLGFDFALGKGREGTVENLRRLGQEMGFSVTVVPAFKANGDVVSSTAIRNALAAGDTKKVARLLGRPFALKGKVASGVGRGKKLGFPTINLEIDPGQAVPADGVYASWTHVGDQTYQSMTNVGLRPTFGTNARTIETHILDFKGDLYGKEVKVQFVEHLRPEKKFTSAEELKEQIARDIEQGIAVLAAQGSK